MSEHNEEKYVLPLQVEDNKYNLLHHVCNSPDLYKQMCSTISQRACNYMMKDGVSDRWSGTAFYDLDHDRHGLALKFFDLEGKWPTMQVKMRAAQWNRCLRIFHNTFAETMYDMVTMANARTMELRGFSAGKMMEILKVTFQLAFDIHYPDITDNSQIDDVLGEPERSNLRLDVSHATFTIKSKRANVCWLVGSEFDQSLCQYFRGVLYYALAFVKQYTKKQKYFVTTNLRLRTYKTKTGNQYRKVLVDDFTIGRHPRNRANSSDDELEYSSEEEEEEEEEEEKGKGEDPDVYRRSNVVDNVGNAGDNVAGFFNTRSFSDDDEEEEEKKKDKEEVEEDDEVLPLNIGGLSTVEIPVGLGLLQITHFLDGTTVMNQPPQFDNILATVEIGRVMSQLDLMRDLRGKLDMLISAQEEIQRDLLREAE